VVQALGCNEVNVDSVYRVVREIAEKGRLKRIAQEKPSLQEMRRRGLAAERVIPAMQLALKLAQCQGGGLVINRELREVRFQGRLLPLFPQEMRILCLLAANPGRVFTPGQIYSEISGGQGVYGGENSVKAQVSRLRQKLPHSVPWITTKRGLGYSFNSQVTYVLI
ncbi:MAG: response regulator transcription factor, partial [Firmicutes bacterium]|nr:response regulator transcription factor [Dethiobacter sp.]MBS3889070.1 response regulator transcription factor [Bacillota bacterium]